MHCLSSGREVLCGGDNGAAQRKQVCRRVRIPAECRGASARPRARGSASASATSVKRSARCGCGSTTLLPVPEVCHERANVDGRGARRIAASANNHQAVRLQVSRVESSVPPIPSISAITAAPLHFTAAARGKKPFGCVTRRRATPRRESSDSRIFVRAILFVCHARDSISGTLSRRHGW